MQRKSIQIVVATHKLCRTAEDAVYVPLLVGAENSTIPWSGKRDNTGDHISARNPNYCELTGLYWAWKNLDADYIGLVHYRRYFADHRRWKKKTERILKEKDLSGLLDREPVLLPKPRHYWIETNYSQYAHAHHPQDLDLTRKIIGEKYPEYLNSFDTIMKRRSGHRFNMLIMRRELLDQYCTWLFSILFELERRLDLSSYNPYDQRVFGFVGERLLDVWIAANHCVYRDVPYVFTDRQNWIKKGAQFVMRKTGRKEC